MVNEDLKKYEERTRPTFTCSTVSSSGDWIWDLPSDSTPTIDTYFLRLPSRRRHQRFSCPRPLVPVSRPAPSERELQIMAMRRQLRRYEEEDMMATYPYRSATPEEEEEMLYNDFISNHHTLSRY